jgi:methyl-accepting chemotaxis protein
VVAEEGSDERTIALQQSIDAVQSAIARHGAQIGRVAKDYSWWNDAVRNLVLAFDPEWADLSIGFYVFENHGYEMSFVVDGRNRTTYASAEDRRIVADAFASLQHGLERLIAAARAAPLD